MSDYKTVTMTKTEKGSPNGVLVREYEKGQTYDLPHELADTFIGMKSAKPKGRGGKKETPEQGPAVETPESSGK